ncbi:MAG: hypothetical protein IKJ29_10270 [Akkermansia sp.]|nr:hypothetical protein [Akkermansia sp.]
MSQDPEPMKEIKAEPVAPAAATADKAPVPESPAAKTGQKTSKGGVLLDTLLVLALLGSIGAGAWYVTEELNKYRVPTPMELAQAEHLELCKQHEELQEAAYQADEQLHMRERLSSLELQIADTKRQIAERKRSLEDEHTRMLALQREIRQEDKTSRAVARNLLIGLPIGNASTTTGKAYPDAVIHRLEGNTITLRTPYGQSRFPLSRLVKDNLPDIARYALGIDDLVDMSDFEAAPRRHRKGKLITPRKPSTQVTEPSYEPESGAPVVDTQKPAGITVEAGGLTPEDDGSWQAPTAPLPIAP